MSIRREDELVQDIVCPLLLSFMAVAAAVSAAAAPGEVISHQKISATSGAFIGPLQSVDQFGEGIGVLRDLDGDGVVDMAVGAVGDDDGPLSNNGAVWILFLNTDGTVKSEQKISATEGGFTGPTDGSDFFADEMASLGDLDGDGVDDLAVAGYADDEGGTNTGAVWILFLHADGTVKSEQKISAFEGGLAGMLDPGGLFGRGVASIGDFDGDGVVDIAAGAPGTTNRVWLLFLHADGTVKSGQQIGSTTGITFGDSVALLGDLDGDGVDDLAVGDRQAPGVGARTGAVWILFLNTDGTVKSEQRISANEGGFTGTLEHMDGFGTSVASLGDLDGDFVGDLAVGANEDDDGGSGNGAVWILFLNTDGTVKSEQKISATEGGFTGQLDAGSQFGSEMASLGDLNGDCGTDLAVGAPLDDDGGTAKGAVWILFLEQGGPIALEVAADSLTWCPRAEATGYDVIRGDLETLRSSGGDFSTATEQCLAAEHPDLSLIYSLPPNPGEGIWFLVREVTAAGTGTYDSGASSQVGSRDAEIASSGRGCP